MREAGSRQADRRALHGGHAHKTVGSHWSPRAEQPPLLDEEATRYPKKKGKKTPKKERCRANPSGHTHEWMKDEEQIPVIENKWYTRTWRDPFTREKIEFRDLKETQVGTKPRLYKLCVHCGHTLVKGRRGRWEKPAWHNGHFRKYTRWNGRKVID